MDNTKSGKNAGKARELTPREERRVERLIVTTLMLVAALTAAYYGYALLPQGSPPALALAIPGLIAGGAVYALYVISSKTLKIMKRRK